MQHLRCNALGNLSNHDRTGGPTVAGLTLAPVPPGTFDQFRMLAGNGVLALTALEAEQFLLAIVAEAQGRADGHLTRLEGHIIAARGLLDDAAKLAKSPAAGDEGAIIRAHAGTLAAMASEPPPDLKTFEHLRRHVGKIAGFDPAGIVAVIGKCGETVALARQAVDQLEQARQSILTHAETAEDPAAMEAARTKRVNARLCRAVPSAVVELESMRREAAALAGRIDAVLAALKVAA